MARESRDDNGEIRNNRSHRNHRSSSRKNSFKRKFHVEARKVILAGGDYGDFEDKLLHFPSRLDGSSTTSSDLDTSSLSDVSCYERKQDWKRSEKESTKKKKGKIKSTKSKSSSSSKRKERKDKDYFLEEEEELTTMGFCKLCGGTEDITSSFSSSGINEESYQNEKQVFVVEVLGGNSQNKTSIKRKERKCLLRVNLGSDGRGTKSTYYNLGMEFMEVDGLAVVENVMYPSSAHYSGVNTNDVVNVSYLCAPVSKFLTLI